MTPATSTRRQWLSAVATGAATASTLISAPRAEAASRSHRTQNGFALDGHQLRFFNRAVTAPFKVAFIADTHLFRDDSRGQPFQTFSARMAKAYNQTKHFRTGEPTHPERGLREALTSARDAGASWVMLGGDILSFPSEAAVEWTLETMSESGLPYGYTAGNHDWHYEGMPGSLAELRDTWIERRLAPLYSGRNPLMWAHELGGVRFVALDNSTYEISAAQRDFFRRQARSRMPLILFVHIPLYAPGRSVGFGCGHPRWGADTDRNWELERRPRWPAAGHSRTTLDFHREVFSTPNLLGVCAGHIHRASTDVLNGIPQVVAEANATAAHLMLEFRPAADA